MKVLRGLLLAVLFAVVGTVLFSMPAKAATGTNQQISFQGKLVSASGVNIPDGTYNLEFKIYQDGTGTSGGTLKWTEDRLVSASQGVVVTAGTFQVNLGSVNTALASQVDFNQDTLWLSMNVGGTGSTPSWDGEMSPYIRLTSVPYALNAGKVGGLTAAQLVQLTPGSQQVGTVNVSGNITTASTLQANTLDVATAGALTVGSTNTTGVTLGKNTTITSGQTLTVGGQTVFNGSGILQAAALTGSSNYALGDLVYATSTTTLGKFSTGTAGTCIVSSGTAALPSYGNCISIGTYNSTTASANGASFANGNLILQTANGMTPGLIDGTNQTFAGQKTFTGDLQVGSDVGDATLINFQPDSYDVFAEPGSTCSTTMNPGSMYYNTVTATMRGCINGNWEDMVSTGGLGLLAFGVVPDSSNAGSVGDLAGITPSNSPCKVYWASATSVAIAPCYAYSGGRKVVVPTGLTLSTTGIAASSFANVCLSGANGAPALTTAATTDAAVGQPAWAANNPILCLATLQMSTTAGTITGGKIYDTRTFTTTEKTFATTNTAVNDGFLVVQSTTNLVAPTATAATTGIRGVVVGYSGATSTTAANVILATAGPQWVKATGGTVNQQLETTTTSGYGVGATLGSGVGANVPAAYIVAGVVSRTADTTCTSATTCQYGQFLNPLSIR